MPTYRISGAARDSHENVSFEIEALSETEAVKEAVKLAPIYVTRCQELIAPPPPPAVRHEPLPPRQPSSTTVGGSSKGSMIWLFVILFATGGGLLALAFNQDRSDYAKWVSERAIESLQARYHAYEDKTDADEAERKAYADRGLEKFEPAIALKIVASSLMGCSALFFIGVAIAVAARGNTAPTPIS